MQTSSLKSDGTLALPPGLAHPAVFLSRVLPDSLPEQVLNRVFARAIRDGELDFMRGRCLRLVVEDLGLERWLAFGGRRLRLARRGGPVPADVCIRGHLHAFVLLATGREDADSLFFNRQLRLSGSTELGLYLKNFLDAFEPPPQAQRLLDLLRSGSIRCERLLARLA